MNNDMHLNNDFTNNIFILNLPQSPPHQGRTYTISEESSIIHDIFKINDVGIKIASNIIGKELLPLCITSTSSHQVAKITLVNQLNNGVITPAELGIKTVSGLFGFFGAANCKKITTLDLLELQDKKDCDIELIATAFPKLQHLFLNGPLTNDCVPSLATMKDLKSLTLRSCRKITNFSFLENYPGLVNLNLFGCMGFKNLQCLSNCKELINFDLTCCGSLTSPEDLKNCSKLESLKIEQLIGTNFNIFSFFENLKNLKFSSCKPENGDFSFIKSLSKLEEISLIGCRPANNDFSFLEVLTKLKKLDLTECFGIHDLSFIKNMPDLEKLVFHSCPAPLNNDLSFFATLKNLKTLVLWGFSPLNNDFAFLKNCSSLEKLFFIECHPRDNDFSFLSSLINLKSVNLTGCEAKLNPFGGNMFNRAPVEVYDFKNDPHVLNLLERGINVVFDDDVINY